MRSNRVKVEKCDDHKEKVDYEKGDSGKEVEHDYENYIRDGDSSESKISSYTAFNVIRW